MAAADHVEAEVRDQWKVKEAEQKEAAAKALEDRKERNRRPYQEFMGMPAGMSRGFIAPGRRERPGRRDPRPSREFKEQ